MIKKITFLTTREKPRVRDWVEFWLLLLVLVATIGFILWIQNGYTTNFLDKIPQ